MFPLWFLLICAPAGVAANSYSFVYQGCYQNEDPNRNHGHVTEPGTSQHAGLSVVACNDLCAASGKPFFGLEYPQGWGAGLAACLPLDGLPSMVAAPDSECMAEVVGGVFLGDNHRLSVYQTEDPTTTTTTATATTVTLTTATASSTTVTSSTTSSVTATTTSTTSTTTSTATSTTSSTKTTTTSSTTTSSTTDSSTTSSTRSSTSSSSTASSTSSSSTSTSTFTSSSSSSSTTTPTSSTSTTTATSTTTSSTSTSTSTNSTTTTSTPTSTNTTTSMTVSTSTTTSVTAMPPAAAVLLSLAAAQEEASLAEMLQSNQTTSTSIVGNFTVVAVRIDASSGDLTVPVEGTTTNVKVPAAILDGLGVDGAVLLVTSFAVGGSSEDIQSAVNINLFSLSGVRLKVSDLAEPVEITLPTNASDDAQCAYWDEAGAVWVFDGLVSRAEDGALVCGTTHFTLFAAILKGFTAAFTCSQLTLMSVAAMAELGKGDWWYRSPAVAGVGSLLLFFMLLLALAGFLDLRRWREGYWTDEDFLIAKGPEQDSPEQPTLTSGSSQRPKGCIAVLSTLVGTCVCGFVEWCKESTALREALDEVMSNWIGNFAEFRDLAEGLVQGMGSCWGDMGLGSGQVFVLLHHVMKHMLAVSARRQASASMQISLDEGLFVLEAERAMDLLLADQAHRKTLAVSESKTFGDGTAQASALTAVTPTSVDLEAGHITGGESSKSRDGITRGESSKSRDHLGQLHDAVGIHLERHLLNAHNWFLLPRTVFRLFLWQTPFGSSLVHCIFLSSTVRVLLVMVDVTGALMVGTVFFEAMGVVQRKARLDCGADGTAEQIGRLVAIGFFSLVIASLPAIVLTSFSTRAIKYFDYKRCPEWNRQLRIWRTQDKLVWVVALLYMSFCMFFMAVFFANVAAEDQRAWLISAAVSVILNTVFIPLVIALLIPLLGILCLATLSMAQNRNKRDLIRASHRELQGQHPNLTLPVVYV